MYSIEEIRENYKGFSDSKIENIARNESKGLRKEVLGILKEEIKKRDLDKNLVTWVDAENNALTDFEKQSLIRKIENLKCPNCGLKVTKLIGQEFNTIVSLILLCNETTENRILCSNCGRNKKIKSFIINLLAGWWSKRGILLTPYTLIKDTINLFFKKKINDRIIAEFIEQNNGMFRLHGTDDETLFGLISWHNNNYEIPEEDIENE
jgi:5-methylcytosine-specific restriction endonuclease McrA